MKDGEQTAAENPVLGHNLTAHEREVLTLFVKGLSNNEIAERLRVSHTMAKAHSSSILSNSASPIAPKPVHWQFSSNWYNKN